MTDYQTLSLTELQAEKEALQAEYNSHVAKGLKLNMARGKPSTAQLDLSMLLLSEIVASDEVIAEDGTDARNYGVLDGLPEAKELMANFVDDDAYHVIVLGTSSLTGMYDTIARCWAFGTGGSKPWAQLETVKWLCPSPGYDRHFAITEAFGIEMIPITMTENGPDMDEVEKLVANDSSIKGIWCVPKYSNPGGITYSDEVVDRLASMNCAAEDFRIIWDNAYGVHHLYDDADKQDQVKDIRKACEEAGNPDRAFKFASTSKVTFPGSGVAVFASSANNIAEAKQALSVQMIGHDKINQLRHVAFLKDAQGIAEHMSKHAAILRPKFELVDRVLEEKLGDMHECSWSQPRGGYFVSFNAPDHTAKRVVELAKNAGVTLTGAGATYPYGNDPQDSNIRIAPSLPPEEELAAALEVFTTCVKLAYVEKLLKEGAEA